ncbi:MAG TPA: galactokinase [Pyrinomonadaceae bacterium]|nr:galactokinase [Pyrinomonadaceae bacterium]
MAHTNEAETELPSQGKRMFRAPGRVNLIGEHTDYNDGFVLPAAIGFSTWVTSAPRNDRTLSVFAENFSEQIAFDLDEQNAHALGHWSDYVRGIAMTLERAGHRLRGAELRIRGEVPIGSGLSSSAALEVASGYALLRNSGLAVDRTELAKLCQQAENEFVGLRCGIMDQFVSCHGQAGKALLLDCRSLEYKLLRVPEHARLAICNTMVKHSLATGEYNARRLECETAVRYFAQRRPNVRALRDTTEVDLKQYGGDLPEVIYRRARHVITENARVLLAGAALEKSDLEAFGQLMNSSHRSLRDDYEVSCKELDLLVELAQAIRGVYGARMTGGGFGGSTVNLIAAERIDEFKETVTRGYKDATGLTPEIYICTAANGVEETNVGF